MNAGRPFTPAGASGRREAACSGSTGSGGTGPTTTCPTSPASCRCPGRVAGWERPRRASGRREGSSPRPSGGCSRAGIPRTALVLGSGRTSVAAFDLTFSAPKSASVLFALGGADTARAVVALHAEAVAGALSYLEQHAVTAVRRSGPDRVVLPTSGAVAAQFTHGVSRNGDPHVHSHVVMANLVHGADGRWGACDRRGLAAHRLAAVGGLRSAAAGRAGVRARCALDGDAGAHGRDRGRRTRAVGRVLDPGRRHPPSHARGRRPLGPRCPRRLGRHPSGQGARRPRSPTWPRCGRSGPVRPALHWSSSPGRPWGGRSSTSTASPA